MKSLIIGVIIQNIIVITINNMDMFLKIVLGHTWVVITNGGWVKPHVSVIWRLVTSVGIVQQSKKYKVVNLIKEKARKMLNTPKMKWISHGRKMMVATHQMEKGSLHPMGQVITPHQTRKSKGMWEWYLKVIPYISSKGIWYWKTTLA